MKIQRYAFDQIGYDMPSDYGEWCKYEDVAKLEAKLEAARAALSEMERGMDNIADRVHCVESDIINALDNIKGTK